MSYSIQSDMDTTDTTTISDMRMAILREVSTSVNNTLAPFMEKVKLAENRHIAILEMLQHHPKYIELLEENIILKKQIRSQDNENVKIKINDTIDSTQVSVSDVYNEFGVLKNENKNLNEKKTVITSLPDAGSAISNKLFDFQNSLEETLVDNHELINEFKTTFSDFLLAGTESDSDVSSIEILDPPTLTRQSIDLTSSWLNNNIVKKEPVDLNDPIQARIALTSQTNSENVNVKTETEEEVSEEEVSEEEVSEEEEEDDEDDEEDDEEEEEEEEEEDEEEEEESDEEEKVPVKARTVPNQNKEETEEESDSEEELYMMELEDDDGNPLEYYCNDEKEMNGDMFEIMPDESVGPKVGVIKNGEIELFE